jgi:hypothetical protein
LSDGGNPPVRRENNSIACTYCSPLNTSSASLSRCTIVRQTGSAVASMMLITLSATSSAAIA